MDREGRFSFLFAALVLLLAVYPYIPDSDLGTFLGGMISLLLCLASVWALRTRRRIFLGSVLLAVLVVVADATAMVGAGRGNPLVEAAFLAFYLYTTVAVFLEAIASRRVTADSIVGILSVYLLIGVTFATLYDLLETLNPGSFHVSNGAGEAAYLGFKPLLYYSFMTLTTVGYGDITPVTYQTQSLALIEGTTGVLYVAVLVARIVGLYSQMPAEKDANPT